MRKSWIVGAALLACSGCECPPGEELRTYTSVTCSEETRMCETTEREVCSCSGPSCPRSPRGDGCSADDGISGVGEWLSQEPTPNTHVIDGAFTGDEWAGATRLEGLFTDVYMDYRDGRLYFLNDWRANGEGIRPDCFNFFQIGVGESFLDLRVYGSGAVEVTRDGVAQPHRAEGAYGFEPSPENEQPHTIYEFSLEIEATQIDVCCFDPITESSCEELAHEPVVVSLRVQGGQPQVKRAIAPGTVTRLASGEACGEGQGICEDGLHCEHDGEARICRGAATVPDAGPPDAGVDGGPPV